ncbi:MAG TPA: DUF3108 domain-containing protein, partial [Gallionella sp.]|nr:DUF3108 domain-containing protein [Gallionella sp.]
MIALPRTSTGRIALAIAVSVLIHAALLFAPMIRLQPAEAPLPPLTAKLEPLPKIAAKPAPAKKKPQPKPQPAPAEPAAATPPANQPDESAQPAEAAQQDEPQIDAEPQAAKIEEPAQPAHPLPRHAQITFIAYKGTDFQIGEARHRLDINDDKSYTLKVGMNTTGLVSIFKTFEMSQQSSGTLTSQGLRPDSYIETRNTGKGKDALEAKFDWTAKTLSFSNGNQTALPDQTQDILSFMYQLSQLSF